MPATAKFLLISGAIFALLAVVLGAFGAHALKKSISAEMLNVYQTGVLYQFYHALALILIGTLIYSHGGNHLLTVSGSIMLAGIVLFSGSLYLLSTVGFKTVGIVTPIGGLLFIISWIIFIIAIYKL